MAPSLGLSMPAIRLSSVDFPEPLEPWSERNSPLPMSRSTFCKGRITCSPLRNSLLRLRISTNGILLLLFGFAGNADAVAFAQVVAAADDEAIADLQASDDLHQFAAF